jgi:DMSO/TMAO reductase YedYZ heme-binding membrane subunit
MSHLPPRRVFKNSLSQWIISIAIYMAIFAFFMWYHEVRGKDYSLWTTEKCTAIAASITIAMALAMGPLSRISQRVRAWLPYRRTLGLVGGYAVLVHVVLVLFYLNTLYPDTVTSTFDLAYFLEHWFLTLTGILSLIGYVILMVTSYPKYSKKLGGKRWLKIQKGAYLLIAVVLVHLLSLGKVPNWFVYFDTFDKPFPPGSFAVTMICVALLIPKIIDKLKPSDHAKSGN